MVKGAMLGGIPVPTWAGVATPLARLRLHHLTSVGLRFPIQKLGSFERSSWFQLSTSETSLGSPEDPPGHQLFTGSHSGSPSHLPNSIYLSCFFPQILKTLLVFIRVMLSALSNTLPISVIFNAIKFIHTSVHCWYYWSVGDSGTKAPLFCNYHPLGLKVPSIWLLEGEVQSTHTHFFFFFYHLNQKMTCHFCSDSIRENQFQVLTWKQSGLGTVPLAQWPFLVTGGLTMQTEAWIWWAVILLCHGSFSYFLLALPTPFHVHLHICWHIFCGSVWETPLSLSLPMLW